MEPTTRLPRFNANSAWLSLPIASPALGAILVLERRPIARQADRPHGEAGSAYARHEFGPNDGRSASKWRAIIPPYPF